jgi:hypothetical protein
MGWWLWWFFSKLMVEMESEMVLATMVLLDFTIVLAMFDCAFFSSCLIATCSIVHTFGYKTIVELKYFKLLTWYITTYTIIAETYIQKHKLYGIMWVRPEQIH